MTSPDQGRLTPETASGYEPGADLAKARRYLERAERALDSGNSGKATPLAAIGTGYAALASAEVVTAKPEPIRMVPTVQLSPMVEAAMRRGLQAAEEARPHDGERLSLHTAIALGIERGLLELNAGIDGCTPSMLAAYVVDQFRDAGLLKRESGRG